MCMYLIYFMCVCHIGLIKHFCIVVYWGFRLVPISITFNDLLLVTVSQSIHVYLHKVKLKC